MGEIVFLDRVAGEMDENEYRNAYHGINSQRCVFEKSILTLNCDCRFHEKFNLAEREGIRCINQLSQSNCDQLLNTCRGKARFAFHLTEIIGDLLPHSKEIQLQKGALLGLAPELPNKPDTHIQDIYTLIEQALEQCKQNFNEFPFERLIPSISQHPKRRSLRKRNKPPG